MRQKGLQRLLAASRTQPIRLLLVDDHALFREGLVRLLGADPEFHLVGAEAAPDDALVALQTQQVDVLLMDYDLGQHSAAEFVADLRQGGFTRKILLVTAGLPDREALHMIRASVAGIFHTQHTTEDLRRTIREVFDGKVLIEEHYLRQLVYQNSLNPLSARIKVSQCGCGSSSPCSRCCC
jgi:two-component system nitrate/nitrite response regulator NarL